MTKPVNAFTAAGLRDAGPYINAHRGEIAVVQFAGEAVQDTAFKALVHDLALLHSLGLKLVLVHGARAQLQARLGHAVSDADYHAGLRLTDDRALQALKETVGCLRVEIEALLSMGLINTPMAGMRLRVVSGNFVTARPLGVREGVDYGHTGAVRKIDAEGIRQALADGSLVLLSPLGYSPTGEVFNVHAIDVATTTALALKADKLILLLEQPGVRDEQGAPIAQLELEAARAASVDTRLELTLRLHLKAALEACQGGVRRVHLVERAIDGGLLKELYTRDGAGTLITGETYEGLRQATIDDVGGILELITPLEAKGVLVRRSREQLELEISRFSVIDRDGMIVGCTALYPFPEEAAGELACLAVHPHYHRHGRGDRLLRHIEAQARRLGLRQLFVLTTQAAHWFIERGFVASPVAALPVAKRGLYNYQRNSKVFVKHLTS